MKPRISLLARRWRRTAALLLVAALLGSGASLAAEVSDPTPASAACASLNKTIGGVFRGNDQRRLSGLVGVVLIDAQGRQIDRNGCPSGGGYAFTDAINTVNGCCATLSLGGAEPNDTRYEDRWQISGAPANAVTMWVEAYPKSKEDVAATPYSHYGGAMRRGIPADGAADIYLPRTCAAGGDTATISGTVTRNGSPVTVGEVTAFSRAPEGQGILGFVAKPQARTPDGRYEVPALARDQRYALRFDLTDGSGYWYEHDYGDGIPVGACGVTSANFDLRADGYAVLTGISQPAPDGPTGPTAPSPKLTRTHSISGSYLPVVGDYRNVGRDDILWFSASSVDGMWRSTGDGNFLHENISVAGSLTPYVGDYDGDGHDDIYWFSPTAGDALYRGTPSGFTATYPNSNGDYTGHVGDFNGDGRDDIYWFSPYGGDAIYYGTPTGFSAIYPNANGAFTVHPGDFNGDGRDDIYWFSPHDGDAIYYGQPSGFTATYPNANGDFRALVGDYDGDAIDDLYWFSPGGGDALYYGNTGGFTAIYPNANGSFAPVVANLDTVKGDDIIWYAAGTGGDPLWRSTGKRSAPFTGASATINGTYQPVVGQFDTTAGTDVLWYDPTDNPDALWHG